MRVNLRASGNSANTSCSCLAPLGHLTADKRLRCAPPELPSATSFIRRTLGEMLARHYRAFLNYINY